MTCNISPSRFVFIVIMKKFVTFLIIAAIAAGSLTGCGEKTLGDELPNDSESAAGVAYSSDNSEPEAAPVESETAPAEEETDPLELANEIIAGLRDDLKICSDLANYNCEVSGGIDGVEVQRRDGSTTTVTLAMIAPRSTAGSPRCTRCLPMSIATH